jgi:ribonuclease J
LQTDFRVYRAALQSERTLVIDLYTAEVLEILADAARIPQPDWRGIKVVVTGAFARMYRMRGKGGFVDRMATNGLPARPIRRSWPGSCTSGLRAIRCFS